MGNLVNPSNYIGEERVLNLIGDVYDASVAPSEWPKFLKNLSAMQGDASIAMVAHNCANNSGSLSYSVLCDPIWQQNYEGRISETDVFVDRLKQVQNDVGVWQGQELIDDSDLIRSEFYSDWMAPQDLFYTVHCVAMRDGEKVVTLGAGRAKSAGHFNQTELKVWNVLIPHLRRAVQIQKLNADLVSARNVMDGGLSRRSVGLILSNADGMVVDTNSFAASVLSQDDGITVRARKFVLGKKREQDRLDALIYGAINITVSRSHSGGGFISVSRPSGREAYKVLVTPAPNVMPFLEKKAPAAAIYVLDPEKDVELNLRELQELFGFTFAESNVAASIVKGRDVNETAHGLNISKNTVRTHLKRIFEKSGPNDSRSLS